MNETVQSLLSLFDRDMDRLKVEIEAYEKEENLWKLSGDINNTAGNLCLHLCGNLQYFIGAVIGNSGYERKRDDEFGLKNIPRIDLIEQINISKEAVGLALKSFDSNLLEETYPIEVFGKPMSYSFFLIHLNGHLNYHLGQINYHRRLLEP
ncbi:MAG: DUF1572 family protein [Cyclobacteriaceae bacterium]